MLDRDDVATWITNLADGGKLSRRSVQICRNVLRAALSEAVEEGLIARSPAARVGLPRTVAKPIKPKEAVAWNDDEVTRFLEPLGRTGGRSRFRLGVLYGLRRSEILALRWDDLDVEANTLRIDESLVATRTGRRGATRRTNGPGERSRSTTRRCASSLAERRADQAEDRLKAGDAWEDDDLIITTRFGRPRAPTLARPNLARIVATDRTAPTDIPRPAPHSSHAHGAGASDLGELRAIADLLGHSPEMLMNTYAHTLPKSQSAVVDRIAQRSAAPTPARRKSTARVVRLPKTPSTTSRPVSGGIRRPPHRSDPESGALAITPIGRNDPVLSRGAVTKSRVGRHAAVR